MHAQMNSASVDVCFFLEFILGFIHMYARCGHAGTWRARTQRLADTTPWRENKGVLPFWNFYRCKVCWIEVLVRIGKNHVDFRMMFLLLIITWCHRKEDICHHMVLSQGRYIYM